MGKKKEARKDEERKAGNVGCALIFFIITLIGSIAAFFKDGFTNEVIFGSVGSITAILIVLYINKIRK
nr:hypothetical protein [uncultured bacterium]